MEDWENKHFIILAEAFKKASSYKTMGKCLPLALFWCENIVEKGNIAQPQQYFLWQQYFQKLRKQWWLKFNALSDVKELMKTTNKDSNLVLM